MGTVATAVGCAVGIPIGVGMIVAFAFWLRLQRRFKRELEDDKDLEREIYDESAFISFNNLDSLRQDQDNFTSRDDLNPNNEEGQNRRKSNVYIPAYRRKINYLQQQHVIESHENNNNTNNNTNDNLINIPPPILSRSSLNSSSPNIHDQQQIRQLSVYDQMVPFMNPQSTILESKQNIIDHISMKSDSTMHNNNITTSNNITNPPTPQKSDSMMIRNIQYQDLGSFYPSVPMSTNASFQNLRGTTSTSSLNNSSNIFNTPNSKNHHNNNLYLNTNNISNDDEDITTIKQDLTSPTDIESDYILKNNYNVNDNGERITEEDQYENEFTNYKENRRQFLDSLRPE
ncbi:suppressor of lethality of KEX2 GAS1 double null mutant protein 1 [Monosporozyma unispora]|nr:suppressor of lethality of KEX2 GAS1 double null mutant protein 1 [Kazachstania unispora]